METRSGGWQEGALAGGGGCSGTCSFAHGDAASPAADRSGTRASGMVGILGNYVDFVEPVDFRFLVAGLCMAASLLFFLAVR